eukprot:GHVU01134647.1.p2 GENE.GHVU01134647.1~~GHVU01134647.1.p2  ORF type:complete len:169 (-),score=21.00 GHVU01134647.1:302-808(-)
MKLTTIVYAEFTPMELMLRPASQFSTNFEMLKRMYSFVSPKDGGSVILQAARLERRNHQVISQLLHQLPDGFPLEALRLELTEVGELTYDHNALSLASVEMDNARLMEDIYRVLEKGIHEGIEVYRDAVVHAVGVAASKKGTGARCGAGRGGTERHTIECMRVAHHFS